MKFAKLSGSTILTVLGVMCAATILVAAVVIGSLTISKTPTAGATVTQAADEAVDEYSGTTYEDLPTGTPAVGVTYDFAVHIAGNADAGPAYLKVDISGAGVTKAGDATMQYWDGDTWEPVTLNHASGHLTGTIIGPFTVTSAYTDDQALTITYVNAALYDMVFNVDTTA